MDYKKIAEQHGGSVDYSALAQQFGGSTAGEQTSATPYMPQDTPKSGGIFSSLGNFSKKMQSVASTPKDFMVGQLKGVATTALSMGELGSSALEYGYDKTIGKLTGKEAFKGSETAKQAKDSELLERKNLAQKAGFMTEQIGEFFAPVPGGAKIKVANWAAKQAPKTTKYGEKALELAGKVGSDITDVTARTYLQTADEKSASDAAIWTGVLGTAVRGGVIAKEALGKDAAARVINSLIKPSKRDFAYGSNPGKAVAEEGIVAKNFDELQTKVSQAREKAGSKIEIILSSKKYEKVAESVDDAFEVLDNAIRGAKLHPRTNAAQIQRLQDIKADLLKETVDDAGNIIRARSTEKLSIQEINALKKETGKIASWTGNPSDDKIVNSAVQDLYRALAKKVEKIVPEIKASNRRYGDLLSAEKAIKHRSEIAQRHNLVSLPQWGVGGVGALVASLATGGAAIPSLLTGMGVVGLQKVLKSTAVVTGVSSWLAKAKPSQLLEIYKASPRTLEILLQTSSEQPLEDTLSE